MTHQLELEKKKYRNWVRGGLAYKYLKEGIEGFADDAVQQEHNRILRGAIQTPGLTCNQCFFGNLRPLHKSVKDSATGKNKCPWIQSNCNCLYSKKRACPNKVCDVIMEEILNSHGSAPPTPNWKNTDIQKWCSSPWEIAKCYINAPGYSDKTRAADIDTAGLLHIFTNNINLQSHLSDSMNRSDAFQKTLQRRNDLFHSPTMEMEDNKLDECIDDIIAILEDDKELKTRHDAQQAVCKLKQLKQEDFIITTNNEDEVCRAALASITKKSEELTQSIKDAKDDIDMKQAVATKAIDDKMQTALKTAKDDIDMKQAGATRAIDDKMQIALKDAEDDIDMKQAGATKAIDDKMQTALKDVEDDIDMKQACATRAIDDKLQTALKDVEDDIDMKQAGATRAIDDKLQTALKDVEDDIDMKQAGATRAIDDKMQTALKDAEDDIDMKQAGATKAIDDKMQTALKDALEALANRGDIQMLKQAVELLNKRVNEIESNNSTFRQEMFLIKQRLTKIEHSIDTLEAARDKTTKQLKYVEEKKALQNGLVKLYRQHYVKTSISPLNSRENDVSINEVYVSPKMAFDEQKRKTRTPERRYIHGYREIFQTNGQRNKSIYIVGDIGTGKSSLCKMMIQNWCTAFTDKSINSVADEKNPRGPGTGDTDDATEESNTSDNELSESNSDDEQSLEAFDENINEMSNFDFLFFIPLQRMSRKTEITEMVKATTANLTSGYVIENILRQNSECCLILVDGLDEWSPQELDYPLAHVSYGLPDRDKTKQATYVTLSRPSAKGILNIKSSEYDHKVDLLGITVKSVKCFIDKYLSHFDKTDVSSKAFMREVRKAKLKHLQKTPLLLQQLLWLYCTDNEIGTSVSDAYSHLLNIILRWAENKFEVDVMTDQIAVTTEGKYMQLPRLLQRFPACETNERFLFTLSRVAFETLTSKSGSGTFGRSYLQKKGVSKNDVSKLIKSGILVEENCFDPTKENTQLEFIHKSYLEFFAAVHVSCHSNEDQKKGNILKDLFRKCESAADILQLSNILKMICGLSLCLVSELSKLISEIVSRDKSMRSYRYSLSPNNERERPEQIQRLIVNCLSENDSDDKPMVSLCDVIITRSTKMSSFLQRIIPENVLSLYGFGISDADVWRWIAGLKQQQYMYIHNSWLSHSDWVLLSSMIQEAPLKYLSLNKVRCTKSRFEDRYIDLSKHDQLQKLLIDDCDNVNISNINTDNLEILRLASSKTLDFNLPLNASKLTKLCLAYTCSFSYCGSRSKYTKQVNSVVHTLKQLRKLKLRTVDIDDSALTVTPEMRNLKYIVLHLVSMSLQTWRTFVDSLLTLHQSVQVVTYKCSVCRERNGDGRNYVRQNEMLVINGNWRDDFIFRSKKKL